MNKLILIAGALALSGCAAQLGPLLSTVGVEPEKVTEIEDTILDNAVRPIPTYCGAPANVRADFRSRVNALPRLDTVAEIGIWCAGDEPLTLGEQPAVPSE